MDHGVDRGSDRRMDHRSGSMDRKIGLYIETRHNILRSSSAVHISGFAVHTAVRPAVQTRGPPHSPPFYSIYMHSLMCIHFGSSGVGVYK